MTSQNPFAIIEELKEEVEKEINKGRLAIGTGINPYNLIDNDKISELKKELATLIECRDFFKMKTHNLRINLVNNWTCSECEEYTDEKNRLNGILIDFINELGISSEESP